MKSLSFTLRPWKPDDLPDLIRFANNPEIAKNLTNRFPHPYTEEAGKSFIEMAVAGNPITVFAIEINGHASGGIGLHPREDVQCKNAEIGYWLAQPFWGQGIATQAIQEILNYGFNALDINRVYAQAFGYNIGSQKVLEKAGFTFEGRLREAIFKNGEYTDDLIYSFLRSDLFKLPKGLNGIKGT